MLEHFGWKNLKERDNRQDLGVDSRIILRRILRKMGVRVHMNKSGSGLGPVAVNMEMNN